MRKLNILRMITLCTLCLCALAACIDHEPECDTCDEVPDGQGILLSLDFDDDEQTRSTLQSSEVNEKEVKEVYLYIFEGNTANARCIHAEPVGWKGEISQKHWISIKLKQEHEQAYTFIAVGVDDRAEAVYGFPGNIQTGTLGQFMAQLQRTKENGETDEQYVAKCKDDMAHTQFFVGYQSRTVTADVEEVALTLRRKVAGILVYLRNIPVNVTLGGKEQLVKKLQVCLHTNQNTKLPLWKADDNAMVFGSDELTDSKVLFEVDLKAAGFTKKGEYFVKKGNDSILDDSYLAGAYLLPIEKRTGLSTLSVNLLGTYIKDGGDSIINHPLKTYEVRYRENKDSAFHTDFAIKENTLYSIGKKLSNSTTVNDKPADLSGNLLELNVLSWSPIETENKFPTVIGPTRIEANNYDEKIHIFDAMYDEFYIFIKRAIDKNPNVNKSWELKVNYDSGNPAYPNEKPTDWIHFENYDEEKGIVGWTNTMRGDGSKDVTIKVVINDYAVKRDIPAGNVYTKEYVDKIKNDIRHAQLEVYTTGMGVGADKPFTLQIRQHNTLTIYSQGDKKHNNKGAAYRGIPCLNFNADSWTILNNKVEITEKTEGKEEVTGTPVQIAWGYFTTGNAYVSGDNPMDYTDGEVTSDHCFQRMKEGAWGSHAYWGSAIQRLTRRFINLKTVNENGVETVKDLNPADPEKQSEKNWYLPAYYEMWGVSETFGDQYEALGYTNEQSFWTSSGDNGWYKDAYIAKIGVPEKNMQRDKDNKYHAMYMVHFDESK